MHLGATNPIVIVAVILIGVLLFNVLLILGLKNRKENSDAKALSNMLETLKNPWKDSDADYDELAKLVNKTKEAKKEEE